MAESKKKDEALDDRVFNEFRVIDRKLIELTSKIDYFLNTLNKIEDKLENKYVTRESFEVCTHDMTRVQNNLTWFMRAVIAGVISFIFFALQFNIFKN